MEKRTKIFTKIATITAGTAFIANLSIPAAIFNGDGTNTAHALTYQDSMDMSFTFDPAVSIQLSSDTFTISDLVPSGATDSNIVNITVRSNNTDGYTMSSTVGSASDYDYTDLRLSSDNTTNKFANLAANRATLADFVTTSNQGEWGYSYSTDAGTSWVSGNTGSTVSGYGALPIYSDTGVTLVDTSDASTTNLQFKIAAKAANNQVSGDYSNVINFTVTAKNPTSSEQP